MNERFIDWSREGRAMRHISAKPLNSWLVLFQSRDRHIAMKLIDILIDVCKMFGKNFNLFFGFYCVVF